MKVLKAVRQYSAPGVLIGAGVALFLAQTQNYDWLGLIWPMFIILPGLPLLYIAWNASGDEVRRVRLVFPGAIITGTGVILMYQRIAEHWHSWTYAWTLYAVFFGMGLVLQGRRLGEKSDIRTGRLMIAGGIGAFILLGLLLEAVVFSGMYQGIMGYLLSALLAGTGAVWALNKWRVHRVLEKARVIEGQAPGTAIRPQGPPQDLERFRTDDTEVTEVRETEGESRRLPRPSLPARDNGEAVEDVEKPAAAADPAAAAAENVATQDDPTTTADTADDEEVPLITEYKPPKPITREGKEPTSEVDPDLQAKIDAALKDEE
ncbi:MAG: hypothetical protein ACOCXZ_00935 [Chloroflexota bacterium]